MSADVGENEQRTQPSLASDVGEWIMPAVSYVDPNRRFCQLCGRPIARRFWRVRTESREGIFCDPAHAALYATYPMSPDLRES